MPSDLALLARMPLDQLCSSDRTVRLDRLEAYYRSRQYESRKYDWDGRLRAYSGEIDIPPGWVVPIKQRRPSTRFDLPRLIVRRFTALVFGEERFPQLQVEGDEAAQDFVRALSEAAGLKAKLQEARNKGGSQGTGSVSFAFVEGLPRVTVHNAKHMHVLSWADWDERRPAAVLEAYSYPKRVVVEGKMVEREYYRARFWDENVEIVWGEIPLELAKAGTWAYSSAVQRVEIEHGYGFCPVYMTQNRADSDSEDGDSDFEGLEDNIDGINELLSATRKGTVANVDPTLVIKDDPNNNPGSVKKGSGNAIWSKGGAEYLELNGTAITAALELVAKMGDHVLAVAGVVLGDPDKMSAKAASAAMIKMLYMPMIVEADGYREQYGRHLLVPLLEGMLKAAKKIGQGPGGEITVLNDGRRIQQKPAVLLPSRWETEPATVEGVEPTTVEIKRVPGNLETVTLNWPPYFPATWQDNKLQIETVGAAAGQKQLITTRTAVENVAVIFGITDIDAELKKLEEEKVADAALAAANMGEPGDAGGKQEDGNGEDDGGVP